MMKININNIRIYGYHGCLEEESKIGTQFIVDVSVWGDWTQSCLNDDLNLTVDYVTISEIAKKVVEQRAKLIEKVGYNLLQEIKKIALVEKAQVTITKISPPIGIHVDSVSFTIEG